MSIAVYELAVEVVLYLVAFQRRVEDGESVTYEDTRAEVLAMLYDLEQRSHQEPGLWDHWTKVRNPLVYLIDEIMILNCQWPHRQDWANDCLEVTLLGHPTALGGDSFYTECDEALHELELSERHERKDQEPKVEILMTYYVALQTGFKGRYALDLDAWREYKGHAFSKLPAYAQTRSKELFPATTQHTVLMDPNYEPVMRLVYVLIAFVVILSIYMVGTWGHWNNLIADLETHATGATVETSAEAEISLPMPSVPSTLPSGGG